ncbi:MAG: site-specific integrase [Atopobiaceae bacterium]|nr:site-specific integrase [Atopobiaceae bacterium]
MKTEGTSTALYYRDLVERWADERELLGEVQPYTAHKAAQKALLFESTFNGIEVRQIDSHRVIDALINLTQHGGRKGRGLSSTTLRAAHLAGTQVFAWAIAKGLTKNNPFVGVRRPREEKRRTRFLLPAQAATLVTKAVNQMRAHLHKGQLQRASFCLATCIAMATGMRRGEIFALTWADVNELTLRISVSKAIKAGGSLGSPKSPSSVRSVAIGINLVEVLNEARTAQRLHCPNREDDHACSVLCNESGEMANLSTFEHWWRKWADGLGHEGLRFHDLRHSHATILIASGVDVKTVQTRLGHSSAEVTMSIYAHAIPQSDSMAAAALDSELFG